MSEEERKLFEDLAIKELDACGYFLNPENRNTTMPELVMKFASLYCMEYYPEDDLNK